MFEYKAAKPFFRRGVLLRMSIRAPDVNMVAGKRSQFPALYRSGDTCIRAQDNERVPGDVNLHHWLDIPSYLGDIG